MFSWFDKIEVDLRDTNKERNLKSIDPIFCDKFKREWDETTEKLRRSCVNLKEQKGKKNESIRYSSSAIEFR